MNETMTSDRLAELTTGDLLTRINELLTEVRILAEGTAELNEQATSLNDRLIYVGVFTGMASPKLAEVERLMAEFDSRLR